MHIAKERDEPIPIFSNRVAPPALNGKETAMSKGLKCPVCGKPLTQAEYDRALGLWKHKQQHIKHLEAQREELEKAAKRREAEFKKLRQENLRRLEAERRKIKQQERAYQHRAKQQQKEFSEQQAQMRRETQQLLREQARDAAQRLKKQRAHLERSFKQRMASEIKTGIEQGVEEQRKEFKKQEVEFRKARNKMGQLENSLKLSANKYDQATEEIKRLKEQLEKGITPQIEGLLEEDRLLAKLRELYPQDKFEHPGKKGDIIQGVLERGKEVGRIVYECKKVKHFDRKHVEQAKEARRMRQADFAVVVTNAFPTKKQYYFVEKTVFVISPVSLEPITYTLRESLIRMALLRITSAAKERAVQQVYDYLSSSNYNMRINDMSA